MLVDPAPGALVRDPVTKLAIAAGADVDPNEPYWARALADGDLLPVETPEAGDAAEPDEAPKSSARRGAASSGDK